MKYVAWLMVVLLLCAFGGFGYLYMTANIVVASIALSTQPAADQQALFDDLKARLENGTALGTVFQPAVSGGPEEYAFYTYTLHLKNQSFLQADMIEIQIVPMDGDVLQLRQTQAMAVGRRGEGDISGAILTKAGNHAVREIIITYYVWGIPFNIKTTYG